MKSFICLSILFSNVFLISTAQALYPETTISQKCISDMAELIGIEAGKTVEFDFKSNSESATCKTTVKYDGTSLRFDFGIKNDEMKNIVVAPNESTNEEFYYEAMCDMDLNSAEGIYSNNVGYSKHYRGYHEKNKKLLGQESVWIQIARDKKTKVSFHVVIINNPLDKDKDAMVQATCF